MLSQTAIFTELVRDYMGPPALVVKATDSCGSVVKGMREAQATSALVSNAHAYPIGIVTEQDICRRIAYQIDQNAPIVEAMTSPVKTVQADSYLYHAIAEMCRNRLRHMPVVDTNNEIVGVLQILSALAVASSQVVKQIELLTHSLSIEGMKKTKAAQVEVAMQLLQDSVPAPEIQTLITSINNDLYYRIVELCIKRMQDDGLGEAPVKFDIIVMGSGGRGESFLFPDQDNGIILADYPDEMHDEVNRWFIELSTRMTEALDQTGFPYCNGHVMATNPLWRKSISQWRQQINYWIGKGAGLMLRLSDIFFDFSSVYGDGDLTEELRRHVTKVAREPFFLREMFKFNQEHEVALGPFNQLLKDKLKGPQKGKLNLKLTGTMPLVSSIRISALAHGISDTSSLKRINGLFAKGKLSSDEQDYLSGAFKHITNLLLRQQLRDYQKGKAVGNHVALTDLSKRERHMLVDSFKAIKNYRKRLRQELTGDIF